MLKACVATVTTSTEETKDPGTVLTKSFMPMECARIAISTATTKRGGRRRKRSEMRSLSYIATLKKSKTLDYH
jgi:hypothetical protein